ncbi:MAG: polysaccharide biosynthesis protein [Clostridia bacterium]|nr:polysaccharide biosynthesis protein [Clostridia bacterium]
MSNHKIRWTLVFYDLLLYLFSAFFIMVIYPSSIDHLTTEMVIYYIAAGCVCLFIPRFILKIYEQIWRYAGPSNYMRLLLSDAAAGLLFLISRRILPGNVTFVRSVSLFCLNLLLCIAVRLLYQWVYQHRMSAKPIAKSLSKVLGLVAGVSFGTDEIKKENRIRIAIVGAGSVGAMLAEELQQNPKATYDPVCFVDIDKEKVGRTLFNVPVLANDENLNNKLHALSVQEVVFALPNADGERRAELYQKYKAFGFKIKVYDFPTLNTDEGGKRQIHDFNIEDLLFRSAASFLSEETKSWYEGKSVLITGGGGSIGSELARQVARCRPSRLVLLDVYENGAYDIQQELHMRYGDGLNLRVEIASACDQDMMEKIFRDHTPDIVFHAAAHKHVPLMERNVCEAISNNVFGTLNVVEACEKYKVKRFIMISTDKAVNPTNVMGATKRMCEMIVQSKNGSSTSFSATRFGNVLGSNGSVIPLFKRQIANGGPVTLTDKRIIRYFMTIPEASQLVMTSGAMAGNGELYVLDMGKPVKILELAENMIRLSGLEPYKDIQIIETGLRPGEKLYEELLIKSEELGKTANKMIFVEKDHPLSEQEINEKLDILRQALLTQSNRAAKKALMQVVPTFHTPQEVNEKALDAEEMRIAVGE